jgi:hypothetical protein
MSAEARAARGADAATGATSGTPAAAAAAAGAAVRKEDTSGWRAWRSDPARWCGWAAHFARGDDAVTAVDCYREALRLEGVSPPLAVDVSEAGQTAAVHSRAEARRADPGVRAAAVARWLSCLECALRAGDAELSLYAADRAFAIVPLDELTGMERSMLVQSGHAGIARAVAERGHMQLLMKLAMLQRRVKRRVYVKTSKLRLVRWARRRLFALHLWKREHGRRQLQRVLRGGISRSKTRDMAARFAAAATVAQCAWRSHVARRVLRCRRHAAWRVFLARVVAVQAVMRMWYIRDAYADVRAAVIDIQRVARGMFVRKRARFLRKQLVDIDAIVSKERVAAIGCVVLPAHMARRYPGARRMLRAARRLGPDPRPPSPPGRPVTVHGQWTDARDTTWGGIVAERAEDAFAAGMRIIEGTVAVAALSPAPLLASPSGGFNVR